MRRLFTSGKIRASVSNRLGSRARPWLTPVIAVAALALGFGACGANPDDGAGVPSGGTNSGGSAGNGGTGAGSFGGFGGNSSGGSLITDGGGGSSGSGQDACASDNYGGKQQPLDMYIVLDRSGSMQGTPWTSVVGALTTFVQSAESDGIGVGLQFFPLPNAPQCNPFACVAPCTSLGGLDCELCDPNAFLPPAVNIAALPGVRPQIISALGGTNPSGGTPTMPALQSAASATTQHAALNPDRKVIIVLASDGEPSGCVTDINAIAAVATAARNSTPSVLTFTIGIGNIAALNTIAQAGGTMQALTVDGADPGQEFLDAMNEIRGQALGCDFLMPTPTEGDADPNKLNVRYTPEGGAEEVIPRVTDASQCQGQPGWYYDNPTDPSLIILCPASCDRVKTVGGQVDIELGCEQIIAPPR